MPPNSEFVVCIKRGAFTRILICGFVFAILFYLREIVLIAFAAVLMAVVLRAIANFFAARLPIGKNSSYAIVLLLIVIVIAALTYGLGPRVVSRSP